MSNWLSKGVCVLVTLFLSAPIVTLAQAGKAELTGEVRDQAGANVARATITVTRVEKGDVASAKTGADGLYTITNLPPGLYTVTVSAQGFHRYVREGVRLTTGERIRVDVTMGLGAVEEEVKINSDASLLRADIPEKHRLMETLQAQGLAAFFKARDA